MTQVTPGTESSWPRLCCVRGTDHGHNPMGRALTGRDPSVVKTTVLRTSEVAEERDLVGVYLHEISRTPLLDAAQEVNLSKAIEAGLFAEYLLEEGMVPAGI